MERNLAKSEKKNLAKSEKKNLAKSEKKIKEESPFLASPVGGWELVWVAW